MPENDPFWTFISADMLWIVEGNFDDAEKMYRSMVLEHNAILGYLQFMLHSGLPYEAQQGYQVLLERQPFEGKSEGAEAGVEIMEDDAGFSFELPEIIDPVVA